MQYVARVAVECVREEEVEADDERSHRSRDGRDDENQQPASHPMRYPTP
jgi:hypothetical protein